MITQIIYNLFHIFGVKNMILLLCKIISEKECHVQIAFSKKDNVKKNENLCWKGRNHYDKIIQIPILIIVQETDNKNYIIVVIMEIK